jgi:hypothetical protein
MRMQCNIVQIGMLVIGCSVGHDGYWMFLFIKLACWLLDVLIHQVGMLVIECSVGHDGYWMSY